MIIAFTYTQQAAVQRQSRDKGSHLGSEGLGEWGLVPRPVDWPTIPR